MLEKVDKKSIAFGGDFNQFLENKLEAQGGNPVLKRKYLNGVQMEENFHLWNLCRIRNPNTKHYTFCQQHSSGYIQRRLDYFFISKVLQESVKKPDVLTAFSIDHPPIIFSLFNISKGTKGKCLWKHNKFLCEQSKYINSMKKHISIP